MGLRPEISQKWAVFFITDLMFSCIDWCSGEDDSTVLMSLWVLIQRDRFDDTINLWVLILRDGFDVPVTSRVLILGGYSCDVPINIRVLVLGDNSFAVPINF